MVISSECFNLLGRNTGKAKILILPLEQIIPRYCSTLWSSFSGYLFLRHQRKLRQRVTIQNAIQCLHFHSKRREDCIVKVEYFGLMLY